MKREEDFELIEGKFCYFILLSKTNYKPVYTMVVYFKKGVFVFSAQFFKKRNNNVEKHTLKRKPS